MDQSLPINSTELPRRRTARFEVVRLDVGVGFLLAVSAYSVWMFAQFFGHRVTEGVDSFGGASISLAAAYCCIWGSNRPTRRQQVAWRLLGVTSLCYAITDLVGGWYASIRGVVIVNPPIIQSIVGVVAVVAAVAALFYMPAPEYRLSSRTRGFVDGVIMTGSILMVGWVAVSGESYDIHTEGIRDLLNSLIAVVAIAFLLALATSIAIRWRGRSRQTMYLLVLAVSMVGVSATVVAYYGFKKVFAVPPPSSIGYRAGIALLGFTALQPITVEDEEISLNEPLTLWQIVTPYLYALVGLGLALFSWLHERKSNLIVIVLTIFLLLGIIWRQILVIVENRGLAHNLDLLAYTDVLTELGNRAELDRTVDRWFRRRRPNDRFAVMLLDLDRFKYVNDTLGHPAGDDLLRVVARRLLGCVRTNDRVVRTGGDEFAILFEDPISTEGLTDVARRIIDTVNEPVMLDQREARVGTSIGVVEVTADVASPVELMRQVDIALYAAKRAGRGDFRFFDETISAALLERLDLEAEIAIALETGQLFLAYQPIVQLADDKVVGAEALLRWRHPRRGLLLPAEFLSLAEESGAIVPIGRWVLAEAIRQADEWRSRLPGAASFSISVNLSAKQVYADDIVDIFRSLVTSGAGASGSVRVELTESMLIDHSEATDALLRASEELGVSLSLDDFGTGYSSLSYLRRLPISSLKIDRSFVEQLGGAGSETVIIEAIVNLAHALHLEVIAEGIETAAQFGQLRALGCEFGQGHLWSAPLDAPAFEAWWATSAMADRS